MVIHLEALSRVDLHGGESELEERVRVSDGVVNRLDQHLPQLIEGRSKGEWVVRPTSPLAVLHMKAMHMMDRNLR